MSTQGDIGDATSAGKERKELSSLFPDRFHNRELSWLAFNDRVLEEALDPDVPVLERLRFLAIFASNLDEFFMVRVAFVRRQVEAGMDRPGPDGLRPSELLDTIVRRVHDAHERIGDCYRNHILPALQAAGVFLVTDKDVSDDQRSFVARYFTTTLHALITPLAIDASHPFPQLENGALYMAVELGRRSDGGQKREARLVLIRVPTSAVGRFVKVPSAPATESLMMIDDVLRLSLDRLFPRDEVLGCYELKIVRDSDLELDEVGSADLLRSIQEGLQRRKKGPATRFLYDPAMPAHLIARFTEHLRLSRHQLFPGARYHSFSDFLQVPDLIGRPDLLYPPMPPQPVRLLESSSSVMEVLGRKDVLLHHPHQSFSYVARFFEEAAGDPATEAIKVTLYRVAHDSRVAAALARAARNGKQVTALIELKARFDEERNIGWARALEEAGVHVVYGVKGLKTHCKVALVVRKERGLLRRYCHLATGNYNDRTARIYDDLGLMTAREDLTKDVATLFHRLTGEASAQEFQHLLVAPEHLRAGFVRRIRREVVHHRSGLPSGIVAKMNSLVDPEMIDELYLAARAGVQIRLLVRGICCLRPGMQGLSDSIEVISILDRFLEHARIYRFENGGNPELLLSSADWMPRNLNSRIEVAFPLLDPDVAASVDRLLTLQLGDTVKARILWPEGTHRRRRGEPNLRAQFAAYEMAGEQAP